MNRDAMSCQQRALEEVVRDTRDEVLGANDSARLTQLSRTLAKFDPELYRSLGFVLKRIAILSGYTFKPIRECLAAHLVSRGIHAEFFESAYNAFEQCIYGRNAELAGFNPDLVYFCVGSDHLLFGDDSGLDRWEDLWAATYQWLGCEIVFNTFEEPLVRAYGNLEHSIKTTPASQIRELNRRLFDSHPPYVHLLDIDRLSADFGRRRWRDETLYDTAKMPVAMEFASAYAESLASVIAGQFGQAKKCLVLDLDNTLWGGVVGDDGWENVECGQGNGTGEAFYRFQRYVKSLNDRGVILAVCSKNQDEIAKQAFRSREDFPLRLDDFACFVANWMPKDVNLRSIAQQLNIGLQSIVLVDDNPAERELVRRSIPEVAVPEMPDDPARFASSLDSHCFFEVVTVTQEDRDRASQYKAQADRHQAQQSYENYGDYLTSLEMKASILPIDRTSLQRVSQLINKTNQFNVRTQRYAQVEVASFVDDPGVISLSARLKDKFGDYGIVAALLARRSDDGYFIDTWVMSCRVFSRGLEHAVFRALADEILRRGEHRLVGEFLPTPKNGVIKDLYSDLGFTPFVDSGSESLWELNLNESHPGAIWNQTHSIEIETHSEREV